MARDKQDRPVLGWDVGGTKSAAVVGTTEGEILDRDEWDSQAHRGHRAMLRDFLAAARTLLSKHKGITRAGVSIGGPLNTRTGVVLSPPHLPDWDHVPLAELLTGELALKVVVEHDAAACLLAEWLWGAARGATHAIYLTCGTGCGAGVMIDGRILRGPTGQTPELGHVRLAPDGPEVFGKRGCTESFCSGEGLGKLAPFMFPEHFTEPVEPKTLMEMARSSDGRALAVLAEWTMRMAQLCGMLADLFSPEVIVLGSLARYCDPEWLESLRREFRQEALPANSKHTRVVPCALGKRLQDLSAIAPCVHHLPKQP